MGGGRLKRSKTLTVIVMKGSKQTCNLLAVCVRKGSNKYGGSVKVPLTSELRLTKVPRTRPNSSFNSCSPQHQSISPEHCPSCNTSYWASWSAAPDPPQRPGRLTFKRLKHPFSTWRWTICRVPAVFRENGQNQKLIKSFCLCTATDKTNTFYVLPGIESIFINHKLPLN